jgi:lipopolysaccharide transport system ATP-binding protein
LQQGKITFQGDAQSAAGYYVGVVSGEGKKNVLHVADLWNASGRLPQYRPWLCKLELYNGEGNPLEGEMATGSPIRMHVQFRLQEPSANFDARVNFVDLYGQVIFAARSIYERNRNWGERSGQQEIICEIPNLPLTPGEYRIEAALIVDDKCMDYVEDACRLKIVGSDFYGTGKIPSVGFFVHEQSWHLK